MENLQKLKDILSFDPTRETPTKSVLDKALEKITKERDEKLQKRVEELLVEAMGIAQEWDKTRKEWSGKEKKMDKKLGGIVNRLVAIQKGQSTPVEDGDEEQQTGSRVD